jgi:hypothetical protein
MSNNADITNVLSLVNVHGKLLRWGLKTRRLAYYNLETYACSREFEFPKWVSLVSFSAGKLGTDCRVFRDF